jgi:hypothetical protein
MAIRETASGSWQWDLKLDGWPSRQRATFKTREAAEAHDLQTRADHKLGKPCRAPEHTNSVAARVANSISEVVEHTYKLHWKGQRSDTREDMPWTVHSQYRNALLFSAWAGPKMP